MKSLSTMFLLLCCLLPLSASVPKTSQQGLTMKIIPPSSPESPFYMWNLSYWERIHRLTAYSNAHTRYRYHSNRRVSCSRRNNISHSFEPEPDVIRPPVHLEGGLHSVRIGIGTFPGYKSYFLVMDTGSDVIWLQCDGCRKCFRQGGGEPPFPYRRSQTYQALKCDQNPKICKPQGECNRRTNLCDYRICYADNSYTAGVLALENFTFDACPHPTEGRPNIRFGCGFKQENFQFGRQPDNKLAGILGLSWGPGSLHRQFDDQSNGFFSYCLQSETSARETYLNFGQLPEGDFVTTELTIDSDGFYVVHLEDISINGQRLHVFEHLPITGENKRHVIVDSGTPLSRLYKHVYRVVEDHLLNLFKNDPNLHRANVKKDLLCYKREQPIEDIYHDLPMITFNFRDADLNIVPKRAFYAAKHRGEQAFCLMMMGDDEVTLLGSYQQINQKVVFDPKGRKFHFRAENC